MDVMEGLLRTMGLVMIAILVLHVAGCAVAAYLKRRWLAQERADRQAERERMEEWARGVDQWADDVERWAEQRLLSINYFWTQSLRGAVRVFLDAEPANLDAWRDYANELRARGEHPIRLALALALRSGADPAALRECCPYALDGEDAHPDAALTGAGR